MLLPQPFTHPGMVLRTYTMPVVIRILTAAQRMLITFESKSSLAFQGVSRLVATPCSKHGSCWYVTYMFSQ